MSEQGHNLCVAFVMPLHGFKELLVFNGIQIEWTGPRPSFESKSWFAHAVFYVYRPFREVA